MKKTGYSILLIAITVIIWALLSAFPLMLLWNWLMPLIFELPTVTFTEALRLVLLASILFTSKE